MDNLNTWSIEGGYQNNAAYVTVKGAIINPRTMNRAPFSFECMIDTGFFSGLYYEEGLRSDALIVGVNPVLTTIRLADGSIVPAYTCVAQIEEINDFKLRPPGIKVTIFMRGLRKGYLGMEALKSFVTLFDGPAQKYKIRF
jgi:hypothetical protein